VVVPGNGGFLFVSLLKALFKDWTFSTVKTKAVTTLVVLLLLRVYGYPDGDFVFSFSLILSAVYIFDV
jgi:hypothetical protein